MLVFVVRSSLPAGHSKGVKAGGLSCAGRAPGAGAGALARLRHGLPIAWLRVKRWSEFLHNRYDKMQDLEQGIICTVTAPHRNHNKNRVSKPYKNWDASWEKKKKRKQNIGKTGCSFQSRYCLQKS